MDAIINTVNAYFIAFDGVHAVEDGSKIDLEAGVETLWKFFTMDDSCSIDLELYGSGQGESGVKQVLMSHLSLDFLTKIRHVPSGHVVTLSDENTASCISYVIAHFKCTPIIVTQYQDQLRRDNASNGDWKFHSRSCTDVQKNFELLADLQLRGKKSYSSSSSSISAASN